MKKIICLISGGLDSSIVFFKLCGYKNNIIYPLIVDYGQKQFNNELNSTKKIINYIKNSKRNKATIKPLIIHHQFLLYYKELKDSYVPYRNIFLATLGCSYGSYYDCTELYMGLFTNSRSAIRKGAISQEDGGFIFQEIFDNLSYNCSQEKIELKCFGKSKEDYMLFAYRNNFPFDLTWSCFSDKEVPCGKCGACISREIYMKKILTKSKK